MKGANSIRGNFVRLFRDKAVLAEARKLIEQSGYRPADGGASELAKLEDAEAALAQWHTVD